MSCVLYGLTCLRYNTGEKVVFTLLIKRSYIAWRPGAAKLARLACVATRERLEKWRRGHQRSRALAERAQSVLGAAAGQRRDQIAPRLGCRRARVSKWRLRFARSGCLGLLDEPHPGQPLQYGPEGERRLRALLDIPPPLG